MSSRTSPQGSTTSEWPKVWRPSSCRPTCAAATTNRPASIARARSRTCQCALPVGTVKAAGTAMTSASASASRANKRREAQVVADGEAELADRRPVDQHGALAGRIGVRIRASSRRSAGRRRTGGSCRSGRGSRPRGRSRSRGWRPCRSRPAPRASRDGARCGGDVPPRGRRRGPRPRPRARRFLAARAESRSSRPDISGVNSISAPPAAASPIACSSAARIRRRIDPGVRLEERDPGHRGEQIVEAAVAVERHEVVAAADMMLADEDLRHGGPPVRALDHLLRTRPPKSTEISR